VAEGARKQGRGIGRVSHRAAAWLAWALCALALTLIVCAVALAVLNRSDVTAAAIFPLALTVSAMVGGLVASRRPENPVGWFFLGSAVCFALAEVADEYATHGFPGAQAMVWLMSWLWVPGVALLLFFLPLYFPNGRLVSPRWRWLVRVALVFCVSGAVYSALSPGEIPASGGIVNPLGIEALRPVSDLLGPYVFVLYFASLFASAASLMVRFRRSGSVERQQIKWLAFVALAIPVWFLTNAPIEAASRTLFLVVDALVVSALIPVAAGVAILRYRLYDIDVVINRTLVYGSLTAMLAFVYFGGVTATQAIFRALTGQEQQPQLAVVVSTLVIAALFTPLRRRIQSFIDRRFYRSKYDARKTLDNFSAQLRNETDLNALSDDLVGVVRETMQPAHVSLWLRPESGSKGEQL
jgi:hypothetical protein